MAADIRGRERELGAMIEQIGLLNAERVQIDAAYAVSRQALVHEDYTVVGKSWAGPSARRKGMPLPIARHETGVQNFHFNVARGLEPSEMGRPA